MRALLAEAIGTFALVFAGAGAIMVDAETGRLGQVGIALAFGLAIMTMIYAIGHVSGAHFNPAVTAAFALTRHFPWSRAGAYVVTQLAAAIAAAALLRASLGDVAEIGRTAPAGSAAQSFLFEIVLTFFLMFVIMAERPTRGQSARPPQSRSAAPLLSGHSWAGRCPAHR